MRGCVGQCVGPWVRLARAAVLDERGRVMAKVWVDAALCIGCGACVSVCPVGAIALIEDRARVDPDRCVGCEDCVEACPVGAIRQVLDVEVVGDAHQNAADAHRNAADAHQDAGVLARQSAAPPARRPTAPLAQSATAVVALTATGLALRGMRALAQMAVRWLVGSESSVADLPARRSPAQEVSTRTSAGLAERGGRRSRQRRRGLR